MILKTGLVGVLILALSVSVSFAAAIAEGDIVFQTSESDQSEAIQAATESPFSHVGIVIRRGKDLFVFEAASQVEYTPLTEWLDSGKDGGYRVMRLKDPTPLETPEALGKLHAAASKLVGRPYDTKFMWSNDRIYCSELVWKMYKSALGIELCQPRRFSSYKLEHPKVKPLVRKRYGAKIPLGEIAVAPGDLAKSDLLKLVDQR